MLDYETAKRHNFTVQAMFAGGFTSQVLIEIMVMNINDNYPYFTTTSYTINVHEYTEVGARLVQVLATDVDDIGSVRMAIESGNMNTAFSIDSTTGFITINKALYLYPENTYTLKIGLTDTGGLKAVGQATVSITIIRMTALRAGCQFFGNSSSPIVVSLNESAAVGTLVVDLDGTPVAPGRNTM